MDNLELFDRDGSYTPIPLPYPRLTKETYLENPEKVRRELSNLVGLEITDEIIAKWLGGDISTPPNTR